MELVLTQQQRDLLKGYKQEAFNALNDSQTANMQLKDIIEVAAESTGLDKKIVGKLYKSLFKENLQDVLDEAEQLKFLAEG